MKLHTHPEEFRELITVVANEKHISESAVERDYYIVMMLKSLADSPYADQCVFKGGTPNQRISDNNRQKCQIPV